MSAYSFPRWSRPGPNRAALETVLSLHSANDAPISSATEAAVRAESCTDDSASAGCCSSDTCNRSSSDYTVAYHAPAKAFLAGAETPLSESAATEPADGYFGAEFQNNWPHSVSADEIEPSVVRELVVRFASDSEEDQGCRPHREEATKRLPALRSFPAWRLANASNVAGHQEAQRPEEVVDIEKKKKQQKRKNSAMSSPRAAGSNKEEEAEADDWAPAAQKWNNSQRQQSPTSEATGGEQATVAGATTTREEEAAELPEQKRQKLEPQRSCFMVELSPLRWLGLACYYLTLWGLTALFTWLLLELSLSLSKGRYPYYMSPHSYCLSSPQLGFSGGDPEPGKVTEVASLAELLARFEANLAASVLATGGDGLRACETATTAADEAELLKPCDLRLFAAKAAETARVVLKDRPAALVQIKRHLGYLPVSGDSVQVTCSATAPGGASLPLKYHSWNGSAIVESTSSGSVPTVYFPMMTRRHRVPGVLVAIDTGVRADWVGKQIALRCKPDDGGAKTQERELLLLVRA